MDIHPVINLPVDESYAFDYLSILEIKKNLNTQNDAQKKAFELCATSLRIQLEPLFDTIINSPEYKECYRANLETFDAVGKAKTDKVKASWVDYCNYQRIVAKQKLQRKFFGQDITETKIGYEIYDRS